MKSKKNQFSALVVMGVSGCGKTTIGHMLAERLGWVFIESDDYHSGEDIRKMSSGIPLTDQDRLPWIERLHHLLLEYSIRNQSVVMACSALKESYRQHLAEGLENIIYIFLRGNYELIFERMRHRQHYMKADMLKSQFDDLEEPWDALLLDINDPPKSIVKKILAKMQFEK